MDNLEQLYRILKGEYCDFIGNDFSIVCLDGNFTVPQLKAIIEYMELKTRLLTPLIDEARQAIYQWGKETCPHSLLELPKGLGASDFFPTKRRHNCDRCWEELKGER